MCGWVGDEAAEELFFGDLFRVGEAEFGEEVLSVPYQHWGWVKSCF